MKRKITSRCWWTLLWTELFWSKLTRAKWELRVLPQQSSRTCTFWNTFWWIGRSGNLPPSEVSQAMNLGTDVFRPYNGERWITCITLMWFLLKTSHRNCQEDKRITTTNNWTRYQSSGLVHACSQSWNNHITHQVLSRANSVTKPIDKLTKFYRRFTLVW